LPHKLSHIELDEISLVDLPANKKKFLFKKAADKDARGYLICDCGHKEALIDFLKSASEECPNCGENLMESATKIIFKGKKIMKKLSDLLIEFIGEDELTDDEVEKFEKADKKLAADVSKAIRRALNILNKFEDFPDDVKESIDTLAKYAAFGYPTTKKKDKEDEEDEEDEKDLEKAGAKLSKATMELIKSVVEKGKPLDKAIKALAALVQKDAGKSAELLVIEEKMDELTEKLDKALAKKKKKIKKEKKEEDEEEDEDKDEEEDEEEDEDEDETKDAEKEVKKLKKRIKALEEKKGTKKSLKGQDDEDEVEDEDEEVDEDGKKIKKKKPWSFNLAKTETDE